MRFQVELYTEVEAESYLEACKIFRKFIDDNYNDLYMPEFYVTLDKAPTSEQKNTEHMESLKRQWHDEDLGFNNIAEDRTDEGNADEYYDHLYEERKEDLDERY